MEVCCQRNQAECGNANARRRRRWRQQSRNAINTTAFPADAANQASAANNASAAANHTSATAGRYASRGRQSSSSNGRVPRRTNTSTQCCCSSCSQLVRQAKARLVGQLCGRRRYGWASGWDHAGPSSYCQCSKERPEATQSKAAYQQRRSKWGKAGKHP